MAQTDKTEWLCIRLSASESEALTLLRATYEIQTLKRVTIKQLLRLMIADALDRKRAGKLHLPIEKTTPILPRGGAFEQVAWQKSEGEELVLKELCQGLPYGQADTIRELIQLDVRAIKTAHIARKIGHHESER